MQQTNTTADTESANMRIAYLFDKNGKSLALSGQSIPITTGKKISIEKI